MKVIALCGSARKLGNTAKMLHQVNEGAKSAGAETEYVNLFDLNYTEEFENNKTYKYQRNEFQPVI
jgi:multimeric flavodoxin WrbA